MNTQVFRAIRVLVPSDLRLIWRDGFLLSFLIFVMPLAALGLHWLAPYVGGLVSQWMELEPYCCRESRAEVDQQRKNKKHKKH